jgi:hypothetical protein
LWFKNPVNFSNPNFFAILPDMDNDRIDADSFQSGEIPAFEFKLTANKSYGSTGVGTISDR